MHTLYLSRVHELVMRPLQLLMLLALAVVGDVRLTLSATGCKLELENQVSVALMSLIFMAVLQTKQCFVLDNSDKKKKEGQHIRRLLTMAKSLQTTVQKGRKRRRETKSIW